MILDFLYISFFLDIYYYYARNQCTDMQKIRYMYYNKRITTRDNGNVNVKNDNFMTKKKVN